VGQFEPACLTPPVFCDVAFLSDWNKNLRPAYRVAAARCANDRINTLPMAAINASPSRPCTAITSLAHSLTPTRREDQPLLLGNSRLSPVGSGEHHRS
jgi:hypothetical protein